MPLRSIAGRHAPNIALALLAFGTPTQAADLLELRGTRGTTRFVVPDVAVPTPAPSPNRVIVRPGPRVGPPAPDIEPARQGASILRIGPARTASQPIADGRIDRPSPRPNPNGSLPGGDTEGGLVVVRQDVRELIDQVAQFYGFETVLSRQVRGDVENATLPSDFNAFLERLATDRDLVFYFRNRELNASTRDENVSRVIGLGQSDPTELRAAIEAAGIDADRFPVRFIEASNSVLIDGPPSFVALVEVIAESLVRTDRPTPEITVIRGNQIERSRAGRTEPTGLAPLQLGPSVLDQPEQSGENEGTEDPVPDRP